MIDRIFDAVGSLGGPWAYLAVGLLAAGESSVGIGLVVPGETGMIVGGFIVSQGGADLGVMLAVAVVGAIVGDSIGYEIGRRFGPAIRRTRVGQKIGPERWETAESYLAKRGGKAIFLGRFLAVVRSLVPAMAGVSKMPYRKFLTWNALGGLVWASIYVSVGFFAGRSYEQVADAAEGAGLVVLGVVVIVAGTAVIGRWLARNPEKTRAIGRRIQSWGPIALVMRYFGGPLRWVRDRFRVGEAFGLSLTVGLAFLVLTSWGLALLVNDVLSRTDLVRIDRPVTNFFVERREQWVTSVMRVITDFGDTSVVLGLLGVVALAWIVRTRRWGVLLFFAVAIGGAMVASNLVKELIERSRPPLMLHATDAGGFAFPSGHTTHATVTFGALAYLHGSVIRSWPARVAIWASAVLIAILVGLSRLYLGVHWLTDVLGGFALGAVWLSIVITAFGTGTRLRRRHTRHRRTHPHGDSDEQHHLPGGIDHGEDRHPERDREAEGAVGDPDGEIRSDPGTRDHRDGEGHGEGPIDVAEHGVADGAGDGEETHTGE